MPERNLTSVNKSGMQKIHKQHFWKAAWSFSVIYVNNSYGAMNNLMQVQHGRNSNQCTAQLVILTPKQNLLHECKTDCTRTVKVFKKKFNIAYDNPL